MEEEMMKQIKSITMLAVIAGVLAVLGGCGASRQARNMDLTGVLVNPAILKEGTGDQMLYRYQNPNANFKNYNKVMIDPVIISTAADMDAETRANYQNLANNAFVYLNEQLKKDYQIVQSAEPGTLRVQMAIVDADSTKPGRTLLSTVMPIGLGISLVKYAATGKPSSVGEITAEFKITDASTGELLGAAIDRRVGGITMKAVWSSWSNADDALKFWSKRAAFVLCENRGGKACEKP